MKPMKLCVFTVAVCAATLSGCVSLSPLDLPPEARNVTLVPVSSPQVRVNQPALGTRQGQLLLLGSVAKGRGYGYSTTSSHLDIVFLDEAGRSLKETTMQFSPRELTRSVPPRHPAKNGSYSLPLASLPAGTTRIEVRAHSGSHNT